MKDIEGQEAGKAVEIDASDFRGVKLPTFWKDDPKLWFAMLEKEFSAYNVRSDAVKCAAVLRHLDGNIIRVVADIISAPDCDDSYKLIKEALISRLASSEETQLRQLLTGIELNGRKPSELLRKMQMLAGAKISVKVLQTLWLQRLPTRIQEILSVVDDAALEKLAALADKTVEKSCMLEAAAMTEGSTVRFETPSRTGDIEELTRQVAKLTAKIDQMERGRTYFRYNRRNRSRSRSGSRSRPTYINQDRNGLCYYHTRFAADSWKCRQPCTWTGPDKRKPAEN
ncbi:uncharacterized protein LOC114881714 [Osmia bicornis bicornis]|uniref:uncharacterized protein LOC114881714 n=1 Tax=Osmia bicornis bicornis TaxID=1437191 RepID=UPI001EAEA72F|nr:uncharacterized protein LOC114881714 [Osmia bicornis bicornis]